MTEPTNTKGNILLVDDLLENLQLLSDLLIKLDYTVRKVTSGRMALKTIKTKQPDIILLDVKMPDMNGYQVCQALKADPYLCDIPVIFISALDETFDKIKAFESGGVDYITKPFQIEEVVARIENQLTIQRQKRALKDEITKRLEAEEILYQSRALLSSVLNSALDGIAAMQAIREPMTGNIQNFRCLVVNPVISKALGRNCKDLIGKVVVKQFLNKIDPKLFDRFVAVVETGETLIDDLYYPVGESCWYHYVAVKLGDGFAITVRDITARKQVETFLRQYERIVSATTDGISFIDRNYIYRVVNQTYLNWHNKTSEEIIGHSVSEILGEQAFQTIIKDHLDHCLQGEPIHYEEWFDFKDHKRRFIRVKYSPYIEIDGTISGVVVNVHDLTDIKQIEQELQNANQKLELIANLDGLTKVANRRRFDYLLAREWQRHLREQEPLALILIDIDHFKRYNDHYGHLAGDDCLIQVAQTIAKIPQRATDLVCRYGGEEFAVILPNTNSQGALIVAEEIKNAQALLALPHGKSDVSQYVTLSLGVFSLIPSPELDPKDLIAKADQALFAAKCQGRNRAIAFLDEPQLLSRFKL